MQDGDGRGVTRSAVDQGDQVRPAETVNRVERTTVHGDVLQAGRDISIHTTHHHPAPAEPVRGPVRVGSVPPLASAFQPREGLREEIDRARARHATVVLAQVLSGGGGVGKSQLAAAYAHRAHAEGVDVLVWVNAAETAQIVTAYAAAAKAVGARAAGGEDAESDAHAFLDWLAVADRAWLVVLDDLTDLEGARPWWPRPPAGESGRVLATTRRRDALVSGAGRAVVDIGTYTVGEAHAYLDERLTAAGAAHLLDPSAEDLVETLGRLPLALAHAAAYMINEDADCARYLRLFTDRSSRLDSLLPPDADTDGYGRRVTTSLLLALDAAQRREPAGLATPAIRLAAHLDPAGHPDLLWATTAVADHLTAHRVPPPAGTATPEAATPEQARAALRLLHHYALLTHDAHDGHRAVRLHALTARAARETTPAADTPATVRAAADALAEIWPEHEHTAAPGLTAVLRANTSTLSTHAGDLLWRPGPHPALFAAGKSLNTAGLYAAAVAHWHQVAADAERLLGRSRPHTLTARANLATSYWQAGRTAEAIAIEERLLADHERLLGHDHPRTLTARANLAASYWQARRTDEAIDLLEQVLTDSQRVLGPDHPNTLATRHNLASSYREAGRTHEATGLLERVLDDAERLLGHDHPNTLTVRGALATAHRHAGRTDEAIAIEEQVLADRERLLGHDHPDTLGTRANLAVSYQNAGRLGEAIGLLRSVVDDQARVLGPTHLHATNSRLWLARILVDRGRALLPADTSGAWRDAAEAVLAVGPRLTDDPALCGTALARAYVLAADTLDIDGQPDAAAEFRRRATAATAAAWAAHRPEDGAR
ncbi:tetratricopeptide repeat protein [Kitasatospora sp. NPDC056184]|uniref:tetratricopeptide repeat protein n=1 Tax=Kitasatospora sp. NPDC056184 TaxID=3345738 RepID=UPI0035DC27E4